MQVDDANQSLYKILMSPFSLLSKLRDLNNEEKALVVIFILYFVGVLGFVFLKEWNFMLLTPFNLLISLFVALRFHSRPSMSFYIICFSVALIGFFIEVAGVNTGLIFGAYQYGPVLGFSLFSTPLSIGVNWLLLIYSSSVLVNYVILEKTSRTLKVFIASSLMVSLDLLIEPVAITTNMWRWEHVDVPLQNYLGWFVSAFVLQWIMSYHTQKELNRVAAFIFLIQCAFFAVLNFLR